MNNNNDCEENKRPRGRPRGFRLSEESKRAISESKKGQRHKQETKDKISRSLIIYFRNLNPLSEDIEYKYCRFDNDDACGWIRGVRDELNNIEDVLTRRMMKSRRRIEISCGSNIEFFSHELTPEVLVLFKEFCELNNLNLDEAFDGLD